MVPEAFNAFRDWLGYAGGPPPANYYELLGVSTFENDPAVISQRAETLVARVRGVQPGTRLAEWQTMLNAIHGARDCLLDPTTKAAYDTRLRTGSPTTAVPTVLSLPARPPLVQVSAIRATWARVRPTAVPVLIIMLSATAVAVAAAFYHRERQRQAAENEAEKSLRVERAPHREAPMIAATEEPPRAPATVAEPKSTEEKPVPTPAQPVQATAPPSGVKTPASKAPATKARASNVPAGKAPAGKTLSDNSLVALAAAEVKQLEEEGATEPSAEDKPKAAAPQDRPAQIDPQKQELYKRTVAAARTAMSRRDLVGAKRNAKAALGLTQTPEQEVEAARLNVLARHLDEFWKTVAKAVAGLTPAQEFSLRNTPIVVVETSPAQIVFRVDGRNRSYATRELPRLIVEALVQGSFADNAATKLLFGTFLAMDAQGDRREARKVWQELIDAGHDIKGLLAELNVPLAGVPAPTPTPGPAGGAKTEPPTDPAVMRQAEQAVRSQFEVDYNLASSVNGKLKLSEKLASAAGGAEVPAEQRFVMLRDARDYALAAGKPGIACEVIDRLMQYFTADPLEMKTVAMEQSAKMARTASGSKETAECALTLVDQAIQAKRWDEAARLAAVAVSTAQKTRNASLIHSAREAKLKVEEAAEKASEGDKKKTP